MVSKTQRTDLAALVALMRENKVLQVKYGTLEVVLHPEAFILAAPAPAATERESRKAEPESIVERDPTLFEHLS